MVERTQVTPETIRSLTWARDQALAWRGAHEPVSMFEFDSWIKDIDEAIIAVKHDRRRLQELYARV